MQTFTGRCLCGQSHFTVDVEMLDVYACHCTLCQKWSGGIAMYLEASAPPADVSQNRQNLRTFLLQIVVNGSSVPAADAHCGLR